MYVISAQHSSSQKILADTVTCATSGKTGTIRQNFGIVITYAAIMMAMALRTSVCLGSIQNSSRPAGYGGALLYPYRAIIASPIAYHAPPYRNVSQSEPSVKPTLPRKRSSFSAFHATALSSYSIISVLSRHTSPS